MMSETNNAMWRERLEKTMPWGSSTGSKAATMMPEEPAVIVRGKGCRVWDADGREFIDFRNSLGPVTLGYCYPEVDAAIIEQLQNGIIYGHPHPLECEVSELLCEAIPCAEQARFLNTGRAAVAACIPIARHYTGREHTIQIGYNGWLNSLAAGARLNPREEAKGSVHGVPAAISALYHAVGWNDTAAIEALFEAYPGNIASIVVAADYKNMDAGRTFYPFLREITRKNGALLVYDEIVTGFRIARGGVQELFGVTPDLAVFAKAIANGMPLSTYLGRREVMHACERGGVSVSSTYGGESLSLAACKAVLNIYKTQDVIGHIKSHGEYIWSRFNALLAEHGVPLRLVGAMQCPTLTPEQGADPSVVTRLMRAAFANGVSLYNVPYVNYSHQYKDLDEALSRLDKAVRTL